MTLVLDAPVHASGAVVAVLSRVLVRSGAATGGCAVVAAKAPVAILVHHAGHTRALDLDNAPVSRAEIEALCPGTWARFAEACLGAPG